MKRPPAAEPGRLLQFLLRLPWIAFGLLLLLLRVAYGLATLIGAFVVLTGLILLFKGGDSLLRLGRHLELCLKSTLLETVALLAAATSPHRRFGRGGPLCQSGGSRPPGAAPLLASDLPPPPHRRSPQAGGCRTPGRPLSLHRGTAWRRPYGVPLS